MKRTFFLSPLLAVSALVAVSPVYAQVQSVDFDTFQSSPEVRALFTSIPLSELSDWNQSQTQAPAIVLAARAAREALQAQANPVKTVSTNPGTSRDVRIALWNSLTGETVYTDIRQNNGKVTMLGTAPVTVSIRGGLAYRTDYTTSDPAWAVVAVKYPFVETLTVNKKTQYRITDYIYSPYSRSLNSLNLDEWGKQTLDRIMNEVEADVRERKVMSHIEKDKILADVADEVVMRSILAVEHMDQIGVSKNADDRVDAFFGELALNEDGAFRYEKSSAGARGLLQFIPSTYANLVKRWPTLGLNPDFEAGTADLHNAMKAQMAYLDDIWTDLPVVARDPSKASPEDRRAYAVAAYNAGGIRVKRAILARGADWDKDLLDEQKSLENSAAKKRSEIALITKQLKVANLTAAKKTALNADLSKAKKALASLEAEVADLDKSRLRAETIGYLSKYRLVAPRLRYTTIARL